VLVHSIKGASLLVGGPGTAKTTVINQFMGKFNSEVRLTLPTAMACSWCRVRQTGLLMCTT
jgi:hypothetical protein